MAPQRGLTATDQKQNQNLVSQRPERPIAIARIVKLSAGPVKLLPSPRQSQGVSQRTRRVHSLPKLCP